MGASLVSRKASLGGGARQYKGLQVGVCSVVLEIVWGTSMLDQRMQGTPVGGEDERSRMMHGLQTTAQGLQILGGALFFTYLL